MFETKPLATPVDAVAPDGSNVRILLGLSGGGMAHFELPAEEVSLAVRHRTVEEIWYFLSGHGEMWRRLGDQETFEEVAPGVCVTLPVGTEFQFRSFGPAALTALGVTMPPWPGDDEAIRAVGPWSSTLPEGPGLAEA